MPDEEHQQDDMLARVGQMTRLLHDNLRGLGFDRIIAKAAHDIPDARDRLDYVAKMTEQAAQRVLTATETASPMQEKIEAGAEDRITLYTGNDDHIVLDLVTPFTVARNGKSVTVRFRGGLLGHWSVWTQSAVQLLDQLHAAVAKDQPLSAEIMALDSRVTDCNAAFFDVANNFHGCIAGCHEVLRRQGLLEGIWCLDPKEGLSPGQNELIDRVSREHADLSDDAFVKANLERWLS